MDKATLQSVPTDEAAAILAVEPKTLEKWRRTGQGPKFVRLSHRCVRYRLKDLVEFQDARVSQNTAEAASRSAA